MNLSANNLAWPVAAVVVAVIGCVTYLAANGNLAASDVTTILVLILGGVGITTTAHVTGAAITRAVNPATPPAPSTPASSVDPPPVG